MLEQLLQTLHAIAWSFGVILLTVGKWHWDSADDAEIRAYKNLLGQLIQQWHLVRILAPPCGRIKCWFVAVVTIGIQRAVSSKRTAQTILGLLDCVTTINTQSKTQVSPSFLSLSQGLIPLNQLESLVEQTVLKPPRVESSWDEAAADKTIWCIFVPRRAALLWIFLRNKSSNTGTNTNIRSSRRHYLITSEIWVAQEPNKT